MSDTSFSTHVIVVGNEKGGSGKSTTAMHLVVALLKAGHRVGAVDLDSRQLTLWRYFENRRRFCDRKGVALPMPAFAHVPASAAATVAEAVAEESNRFREAVIATASVSDFLVIDCPGSDSPLSRLGHSFADTLVTPMNDSFVDLSLLADIDPDSFDVVRPSQYAVMVWEQRKQRFTRDRGAIDWVVMRNRLSHVDAKNKRRVAAVLDRLAPRVRFRVAPGLSERVIFRELYLSGLTLMDVDDPGSGIDMSMSHVAARQELRALVAALNLPGMPTAAGQAPAPQPLMRA